MDERAGLPDDEELLSRRMLTQILGVVVASSMFVLALYLVGVVGNARGDRATSTTEMVAQMSPTMTSDTPPSSTAAPEVGTAATSSSAEDTGPTPPGSNTEAPAVAPRIVDVSASEVRSDSRDSCGAPTSYQPSNAVDSVRETAWMAPGDGVGAVLTIELAEPSVVSEVGLVPGYDKSDPCTGTDRFNELRRVTAVRWTFDDSTSIDQELSPTPDLQTISLELPVVTSRVSMTILGTTEPGDTRLDHAPVSEVTIS